MTPFYDQDGQPITVEQWGALFEDVAGRTIAEDTWGAMRVATLWLGYVDPIIESARLFGTALFRHKSFLFELETYDNKADALAGHARHVAAEKAKS